MGSLPRRGGIRWNSTGGRSRSKFGSAPVPVEPAEQMFWSFFGGIPPVKWRHLANRSCTSGAIRRIDSTLVALPGGHVTNQNYTNACVLFFKVAPSGG